MFSRACKKARCWTIARRPSPIVGGAGSLHGGIQGSGTVLLVWPPLNDSTWREWSMDGVPAIQFELASECGALMHGVFAQVVKLLMSATRDLEHSQEAAKTSIRQATSLLQAQMRYAGVERQGSTRALLPWRMRRVESYIEEHIGRPILVADLSALFELSEAHFSRAFRLSYGQSPRAYILRRRIELAAQLMLAGRDPLSEIALKCGFHDQAHLSNQFRKLTGEPPAAWRRLRRGLVGMATVGE